MSSRWTCGPLAVGTQINSRTEGCELHMNLNHFRYVRQIQIGEPLRPMSRDVRSEVYQLWSCMVLHSEEALSAVTYWTRKIYRDLGHLQEVRSLPHYVGQGRCTI